MTPIRAPLAIVVLAMAFSIRPAIAEAVTVQEIVDLTRAGMSDEVIVALIKSDQTIFTLNAPDLVRLKEAGVSQKVLLAMLQSGRDFDGPGSVRSMPQMPPPMDQPPVPSATVPMVAPTVVVIESRPDPWPVAPVVYLPAPIFGFDHSHRSFSRTVVPVPDTPGFGRFINDGWRPAQTTPAPPPAQPVFWGWDGKLRPGAWKPN